MHKLPKELSVLVADDEALVRQGIVALLSDDVGHIAEACDGDEALSILKHTNIDVALIDIGLPRRTGLDVMTEVRQWNNPVKIIILTGDTETHSPRKIMDAGADGFLYKTADAQLFIDTFLGVARGNTQASINHPEGKQAKSVAEIRDNLTVREQQIIKLVTEGASNAQAAKSLFISEHTVRKHREHINKKLGINSPAALANFAIKAGLV